MQTTTPASLPIPIVTLLGGRGLCLKLSTALSAQLPGAGRLLTDPTLSARGLYPAVDVARSGSALLEEGGASADHQRLAAAARASLTKHPRPSAGTEQDPSPGSGEALRARLLEAYLTQPFYVAEPFTSKEGQWVSIAETLADVEQLLQGELDARAPADLLYRGRC